MTTRVITCVIATSLLVGGAARAQDVALPEPVAEPSKPSSKSEPEVALDVDRDIDLANVVTAAAKGVTTVQEAPTIITVITADEIKARGHRTLTGALDTIPGWMHVTALGTQVENVMVRGVGQAVLTLRDGVSMFDPYAAIAWVGRTQPVEVLKRIEVVTGPGGVLWGANSFLGVANLITKDAEDVDGLELAAGYGDGPGNRQDARAYAMFGRSFFHRKLKIFQHLSYENYLGELHTVSDAIANNPAPLPGGPAFLGPDTSRQPPRSWIAIVDGKYSLGPVSLYYMLPFGEEHPSLSFGDIPVDGTTWRIYDRSGALEYKDRFLSDKLGLTAKLYGVQFVREIHAELLPPSAFFPPFTDAQGKPNAGGLVIDVTTQKIFRVGGTVDFDVNLPYHLRLLVGGELFYEAITNSTQSFPSVASAANLPAYCPVDAAGVGLPNCPRQFINDESRYVGAAYVNAQWRPFGKLSLDGGVRYQQGFGQLGYSPKVLGSAAVVWNFVPDFHFKANFATGFRPPVFQATSAGLGGTSYGANPNLLSEDSKSFQGELNARVLRNVRNVRELELRVDYSYTVLANLIEIRSNTYGNTGKRGIHSVEGYAKLYLNGDHFLQASYTYLNVNSTDVGVVRYAPKHWAVIGASFNLVKHTLDVNANLSVFGAYEDPNRYPGVSGGAAGATTTARTTDLTWDRLTPVALLQLGFRLRFLKERLGISGQFYNVLNQRYYQPDALYDITPTVEVRPNPQPGFNFFAQASYHF